MIKTRTRREETGMASGRKTRSKETKKLTPQTRVLERHHLQSLKRGSEGGAEFLVTELSHNRAHW